MKQGPIGTAVIGCGRISRSHLAAVATQPELARLVAVVDTEPKLAQRAAAAYGAAHALVEIDSALARDDVQAVVVCLPSDLHAPVAIKAAAAGKHVLVEKPMANSAAEAAEMARQAEESGVVLAIGQCRRYFRAMEYLMNRRGDFGELISVQLSLGVKWHDAQAPWWREPDKAGGLVIGLNGPHALDFVQMVMGAEDPVRVHAEAVRRQGFWEGEDEAMILLAYPSRRLASVHLSFNQDPVEDRKVLVFERGTAVLEADRSLSFNGALLVARGEDETRHYLDEAVEFRRQFHEFVKAIRGEPHRAVLAPEGVRLMGLLDAVRRAYRDGVAVELAPAGAARKTRAKQLV